jgi:ADP-ribose pyrophosphatase YjhB (NUDIX family)
MMPVPRGPLPQDEYEAIYAKVPRLTVEVVIASAYGVLLTIRHTGPCRGLWHIPGGTVRFGEPLTGAVERVAQQELHLDVRTGRLLGFIEYPSHLAQGLDWPVGMAFLAEPGAPLGAGTLDLPGAARWYSRLPDEMHDEQREFLRAHDLAE